MGYKHTDEAKAKLSCAKRGRLTGPDNSFYGRQHTPENKAILSESAKRRPVSNNHVPVILTDLHNNVIGEFLSMFWAAIGQYLKADRATLLLGPPLNIENLVNLLEVFITLLRRRIRLKSGGMIYSRSSFPFISFRAPPLKR